MLHLLLQAGPWDPDGVIRVIASVGTVIGLLTSTFIMWRKLETIRIDVNSAKALLELKLAQALDEKALLRKIEAQRTGDPADVAAALRAIGAAEQAAKPLPAEAALAAATVATPAGAQGAAKP